MMHALREVIAALDRRVHHERRPGAGAIARDARQLRQQAVARLATLERAGRPAAES